MALESWTLREIEYQREGRLEHPITDELAAHGRVAERVSALAKLKLLCAHGWPSATSSLKIDKVADGLFVLKCKPGCWRIYFHMIADEKAFLLLHAVCKKTRKRNPHDPDKASRRLADYQRGTARAAKVAF